MSYSDHKLANIDDREKLYISKTKLAEIYADICNIDYVYGCVILSTCNRTEIYMSLADGIEITPSDLLCEFLGIDKIAFADKFKTRHNKRAIEHLSMVACGFRSQIWGEDQIITQVKDSVTFARENTATDPVLEVMFRKVISGAKKVKTLVDFKTDNNSTAKCAADIIAGESGIKSALVIGNGEIGRLTAQLLCDNGIDTSMTLRTYKHKENIVPTGVQTVNYADRYAKLAEVDAVVSATTSPHFTIEHTALAHTATLPKIFIDLAVPRDIDPAIEDIDTIKYYNIDTLKNDHITYHKLLHQSNAKAILAKYIDEFYKWHNYKVTTAVIN